MRILLLGPLRPELIEFLKATGDEVITTDEPIEGDSDYLCNVDFIISYGYRYILKKELLDRFKNRAINLHISLLPWNRGADPNLWSFLEDTPKGVTIHYIDDGIDTGDILAQQQVNFSFDETLSTTYQYLSRTIEDLFRKVWPQIRVQQIKEVLQPVGGSYHRAGDSSRFQGLLTQGWDTQVKHLIGKALNKVGDK